MIKRMHFFLLFCLSLQVLPAQKKVILEKVWCQSMKGSEILYLQNEEIRKSFGGQLNTSLLKYQHMRLADTSQLNIKFLNEIYKTERSIRYKRDADTSRIHMFVDIFENASQRYFQVYSSPITKEDSALMNRAKSVFQLQVILLQKNSIIFNNTLDIMISTGLSPGVGVLSDIVNLTPRGFAEMLKTGIDLLLNPENDLVQIEVKAAPAFMADNYFLSKTARHPRVYVSTTKDISKYTYNNFSEMIRLGQATYEEIRGKGKKADKSPGAMLETIRKTDNFSLSSYVFLRQECRDVLRNKNYLLKLLVQINPEKPPLLPLLLFTGFLAGNIHYLFGEKDTVAIFSIEKTVLDTTKKLYPTAITNGLDSSSFFSLDNSPPTPFVYAYLVKGQIGKRRFSIKCSGFGNTVKEIYLDDTLICIAQGKFSPEKFVFFDASLSPELFNQLLMIGFNPFFE